jgi:putative DNA primase/helicase
MFREGGPPGAKLEIVWPLTAEAGLSAPVAPAAKPALAELLDDTAAAVRRHIVLAPEAADVVALWIGHTWVYERFDYTPRLAITSPVAECGKSMLLEVIASTCRAPVKTDNVTPASMFRLIEARKPQLTILADEYDTYITGNDELRGIVNSGHQRSGAVLRTERTEEGQFEVREFPTFAPLALAGIKKLPATIASRALPILLQRKAKADRVEKFRENGNRAKLAALNGRWERWAVGARLDLNPDMPDVLGDRQGDVSVPLLAIADAAGKEWGERARRALVAVFKGAAALGSQDDKGLLLLKHLREIFEPKDRPPVESEFSMFLCDVLAERDDGPWKERGRAIEQSDLAKLLAPFGIKSKSVRKDKLVLKGYYRKDFFDAWKRYLG